MKWVFQTKHGFIGEAKRVFTLCMLTFNIYQ